MYNLFDSMINNPKIHFKNYKNKTAFNIESFKMYMKYNT